MAVIRFIYKIRWLLLEIAGASIFIASLFALFILGKAMAQGGIARVAEMTHFIKTYPIFLASMMTIIYIGYIGYTMLSAGYERRNET